MSLRLEMLQVARLAPRLLGESADRVREFVLSQRSGAGFAGRDGQPDLYYTVFGADCLHALQAELPPLSLEGLVEAPFPDDAVRLACMARLTAALRARSGVPGAGSLAGPALSGGQIGAGAAIEQRGRGDATRGGDGADARGAERAALAERLRGLRRSDGGFAADAAAESSTVYASFLVYGALQDLGLEAEGGGELAGFLRAAAVPGGGFGLAPGLGVATTPTTAAAVAVLHQLGQAVGPETAAWLTARASPRGGFTAAPETPVPDLLSTAVALHALSTLQAPVEPVREACLDFVDTLWSARGGFFGHWAETELDCEYTFYGLLALGHLAV